jgi:hypothetical protein
MDIIEKITRFTDVYLADIQNKVPFSNQCAFKLGNCYLRKKEYLTATKYFKMSINSSFTKPQLWRGSGQVNWLVDILILSKQLNLLDQVIKELETYKLKPNSGYSPIAHYSYCVADFLNGDNDTKYWIDKLLEKPSVKDIFFGGEAFQAIVNHNETEFNQALSALLKIHDGQAKHGALRETAEGLICMPAMSLIYLAMKNGIAITTESEYIAPDYFQDN